MQWRGMTLVELVITIGLMSTISALAIPSFRQLQARQSLRVSQREIQGALYHMQELTLAPADYSVGNYDVVGYGLYMGDRRDYPCDVDIHDDSTQFLALYKFVRFHNETASLAAVPQFTNPISPTDPNCSSYVYPARKYPNEFFILPPDVRFRSVSSRPWMIALPLSSVGQSLGSLPIPSEFINPLASRSSVDLVIEHKTAKIDTTHVSRFIRISKTSNSFDISSGVNQ